MRDADPNIDPVQGEFFTDQDIADRLVRETLQNSLDARRSDIGTEQVRVRFALHRNRPLPAERAPQYFQGLGPHLEESLDSHAPGQEVLNKMDGQVPVPYLLIEDFNTTGLTGDIQQIDDWKDNPAEGNHFYWFVRNVGRSGKRGIEGGSWGVGKWVFPDASKINSFLFLTHRSDDGQEMIMGQSVLKNHILIHSDGDRHRYPPYGFFIDPNEYNGLPLPIMDPEYIRAFKNDFQMQRESETGLSLAIPFPEDALTHESITKAVVRYYFYPILSDDLIVEVRDDNSQVVIDLDSIYQLASQLDWAGSDMSPIEMTRMFDLAQSHAIFSDEDRILADEPPQSRTPTMDNRFDDAVLDSLRERYEQGERLPFRIPVWVSPKGETSELSYLDLLIERDTSLSRAHTEYVRTNLTIPGAGTGGAGTSTIRAFLIVEDPPLAGLLRDSEEPSHYSWKRLAQRVRERYNLGPSTVTFVNRSLLQLMNLLTRPQEGIHRDLLQDYFNVPETTDTPPGPDNGGGGGPINGPVNGGGKSPLEISRISGGFTVTKPVHDELSNQTYRIRVAYNIRRRDPFSRYDPRDFRLDSQDISVVAENADLNFGDPNELLVEPTGSGSTVTVTGFDTNRDIVVRADIVE